MNTFLTVLNAFPAILATVQALEVAIPMPKTGQQKLNLILNAATAAWEIREVGEQMTRTNLLAGVEALTNITVSALNSAGVFGTSQSTTSAAPAPATPVSSN
jgi:hypothetical protein